MLNPVYIWDAMRLCHCGGTDSPWFDKAIQYLEKVSSWGVQGGGGGGGAGEVGWQGRGGAVGRALKFALRNE